MASQDPLSPEYSAFRQCYESVVATIKLATGLFCDQLFAKGYISEDDHDFVCTVGIPDNDKARRLANAVTDRIKQDTSVFHGFLELEIVNDPSRDDFRQKLRKCFEREKSQLRIQSSKTSASLTNTDSGEEVVLKPSHHREQQQVSNNPGEMAASKDGDSRLDISSLLEALVKAQNEWYNLGLALGVDNEELTAIVTECRAKPLECLRKMLTAVLHSQPELTWRAVHDALKNPTVRRHDVAEEIRRNYDEASGDMPSHQKEQQPDCHQEQADETATSKGLTIEVLKTHTGVSDSELDRRVLDSHLPRLSELFDNTDDYIELLGLSRGQHTDVNEEKFKATLHKTQAGMKLALRYWMEKNPKNATYRSLLNIVLSLDKGDIATDLCKYIHSQASGEEVVLKPSHDGEQQQVSNNPGEMTASKDSDPACTERPPTYQEYLYSFYDVCESEAATQFPTPQTKKVFKLAMIKKEGIERGEIDEDFVRMTITGKVDDILEKKTPIELENIFSEIEDGKRRFVLIEGAPGTGKSTLALHMGKQWRSGKLYQEYTAVVLVKLRDPQVRNAKSLADLLPCATKAMAAEAEKAMTDSLGKGVLMILDGWDELPPNLPTNSIIHKLVKPGEFQGSPIPNASIVITSRPTSSAELHPLVSSRIEVLGFTPKELEEYFKECLNGDSQAVESLMKRIQENPVIEGSCYIPFIASMVAHIYVLGDGKLPGSNTRVFESLVLFTLSRYMQDRLGKSKQEATLTSLKDLPRSLKNLFTQLCSLAYYGITNNKVTFVEDDFKSAGVTLEVCDLGLLQVFSSTHLHKTERYYNFLHLSIQELLAAIHISQLSEGRQLSVFEELLGNPRFTAVFQFYAGVTKLKVCRPILSLLPKLVVHRDIRDIIITILEKRKRVQEEQFRFLRIYEDDRSPIQTPIQTCNVQLICLLHCLYEAEDSSLCVLVADHFRSSYWRHLNLSNTSLSPLDCLSVGHFLSVVAMTTSGVFKVDLDGCSIGDQGCKLLSRGFSKSFTHPHSDSTGKIALDIVRNNIHEEGARHIAELVKNTSVIHLSDMSGNPIGDNGVKHLCQALCANSTLENLNLAGCSLTLCDDTIQLLSQILSSKKSIKTLNLCSNPIGNNGVKHLCEALCTNSTLEDLNLMDCSLTLSDDTGPALSQFLSSNKSIKTLNLSSNHISNNGVKHLCEALCTNSTLEVLDLRWCSLTLSDDTGPALSQLLSNNKSIKTLNLSGNPCSDCRHLAAGLSNNKTLTTLRLTYCDLTDDSVEQLCTGLGNHIEELYIPDNDSLTMRGLQHLAGRVITLSALRELVLPGHLESSSKTLFKGKTFYVRYW